MVNGLEFIKRMQGIEGLKHIELIIRSTSPEQVMSPWLDRNNARVNTYQSQPVWSNSGRCCANYYKGLSRDAHSADYAAGFYFTSEFLISLTF